jgi:AmmeMemoRadiSam system protein B
MDFFDNVPARLFRGGFWGSSLPCGYMYSGQIADTPYKEIKGQTYDVVFVIGSSHRAFFEEYSFSGRGDTKPMGIVDVHGGHAVRIWSRILELPFCRLLLQEHSVKYSPFLQFASVCSALFPCHGRSGLWECRVLADAIVNCCGNKQVLIVGVRICLIIWYEQPLEGILVS